MALPVYRTPVGSDFGGAIADVCERALEPLRLTRTRLAILRGVTHLGKRHLGLDCRNGLSGQPLEPEIANLVKCLSSLCNAPGKITCDDQRCENESECGHSFQSDIPGEGNLEACKITICASRVRAAKCGTPHDISMPHIPDVLLHEMLHCCGIVHGKSTTGSDTSFYNCNSMLACCIYHELSHTGIDANCAVKLVRPPR